MRVLLQVDMEGASRITSYEEVVPIWPTYWERGRQFLTADVNAAITGLFQGGATEIVVDDQHLSRPGNVISEMLPAGASMPPPDVLYRQLQQQAFDAVFQIGRHARWGTNDAFMAHTQMPGLGLAIDGALITESHICALRAGVPVLGITGDDKLREQIDGVIAGTPYLVVKRSRGLTTTEPRHTTPQGTWRAIRAFARRCAENWRSRPTPKLPQAFTLSAFTDTAVARRLVGCQGLEREGDEVVRVRCNEWWTDAEPAMQAATYAAAATIIERLGKSMVSSAESIRDIDPAALEATRRELTTWLLTPQRAWSA